MYVNVNNELPQIHEEKILFLHSEKAYGQTVLSRFHQYLKLTRGSAHHTKLLPGAI